MWPKRHALELVTPVDEDHTKVKKIQKLYCFSFLGSQNSSICTTLALDKDSQI